MMSWWVVDSGPLLSSRKVLYRKTGQLERKASARPATYVLKISEVATTRRLSEEGSARVNDEMLSERAYSEEL